MISGVAQLWLSKVNFGWCNPPPPPHINLAIRDS